MKLYKRKEWSVWVHKDQHFWCATYEAVIVNHGGLVACI